jgi:hypothetical protein
MVPLYHAFTIEDMPTAQHYRARVLATLGAAGAHIYLAALATVNLLNFTVPSTFPLLAEIGNEDYWIWAQGLSATLLVLSLLSPKQHVVWRSHRSALPITTLACNLGAAMMFAWALFNMVWGLSAARPVSLAGPGLAFVVAFGEHLLALAWARGTYKEGA